MGMGVVLVVQWCSGLMGAVASSQSWWWLLRCSLPVKWPAVCLAMAMAMTLVSEIRSHHIEIIMTGKWANQLYMEPLVLDTTVHT